MKQDFKVSTLLNKKEMTPMVTPTYILQKHNNENINTPGEQFSSFINYSIFNKKYASSEYNGYLSNYNMWSMHIYLSRQISNQPYMDTIII